MVTECAKCVPAPARYLAGTPSGIHAAIDARNPCRGGRRHPAVRHGHSASDSRCPNSGTGSQFVSTGTSSYSICLIWSDDLSSMARLA